MTPRPGRAVSRPTTWPPDAPGAPRPGTLGRDARLPAVGGPTLHDLQRIVDLARRAPSLHNTQPWSWRVVDGTLELRADRRRWLPATDPSGRGLVVSCGAALHHAQVAARTQGLEPTATLLPRDTDSSVLARLRFTTAPIRPRSRLERDAALRRHTDRRRLTAWPVPAADLRRILDAGHRGGAAVVVVPPDAVARVEELVEQARHHAREDDGAEAERRQWVGSGRVDGVPLDRVPSRGPRLFGHAGRFGDGELDDPTYAPDDTAARQGPGAPHGVVLAIGTAVDGPLGWLRAGQSLSSLWLEATAVGLSVQPQSQLVDVEQTRRRLRREVLADRLEPHLLLRIGWHPLQQVPLGPTPRRPLDDVLGRAPERS